MPKFPQVTVAKRNNRNPRQKRRQWDARRRQWVWK